MGRLDVMKSFLRSAAREASGRLERLDLGAGLREFADQAVFRRINVEEAKLTAAVGRIPGVTGATVSVTPDGIAVQVVDDSERETSATYTPHSVSFAARGAKEITFRVAPPEAADHPRSAEVFGAIAGEIARAFWGPFLRRGSGSQHQVFVHRNGALLSADLRTVPEVRAAMSQRGTAAMLDFLRLKAIELDVGKLRLQAGLEGMP